MISSVSIKVPGISRGGRINCVYLPWIGQAFPALCKAANDVHDRNGDLFGLSANMPSFLKDHLSIRRKSKTSLKQQNSDESSSSSENGSVPPPPGTLSNSSSTLNLGKRSPPTTFSLASSQRGSNSNLAGMGGSVNGDNNSDMLPPPVPTRPRIASAQSNRYSISVCVVNENVACASTS